MILNISNIQHFSTGDGEGIRTTVFFKGCNLRCPWCHNPENLSAAPSVLHYKNLDKTEIMGKRVTVDEILPELLEDKDFYDTGSGGVTLSGGEVMLQASGAAELAGRLKEKGVSVLIDTAGSVPYSEFEKLNAVVQGYLFDFKTADAKKYKEIGGDLELVSENIKKLKNEKLELHIRIPLIPGFNTDLGSLEAICRHLEKTGIKEVELLPFHRLGSGKYEAMGLEYKYAKVPMMDNSTFSKIAAVFLEKGFKVKKEG